MEAVVKVFSTKVVFLQYPACLDIEKGFTLRLQHEATNTVDCNAIMVLYEEKFIGYLKKDISKELVAVISDARASIKW